MGLSAVFRAWYASGDAVASAKRALEQATTYQEYEQAAQLLDFLEERNSYKAEPLSVDYDASLISARMAQLRQARVQEDSDRVLFLLRTTLSRNLGNMGNANLYARTHIGTKYLIDEYILEVQLAFNHILEQSKSRRDIDTQGVLESVLKTRQAFGRTALLLSGGGTLGMMHIGVIKTLFEMKLLPRIISGSSAGAIVAAIVCTVKDEEMSELVGKFHTGNLQVFQYNDAPETIFTRLARFLKHGVFMEIQFLRNVMSEWMGNMTFAEAFNKTRRILNITVSSSSMYEMPRLLNYITAPNVVIWSAVAASCSIPGIFAGSPLLAKDSKTGELMTWDAGSNKCIDGSIEGDLPTVRLSELFNVNHFLVSQVNPHVTLFLPQHSHDLQKASGLFNTMVVNELLHLSELATALNLCPAVSIRLSGILKQRYIGDITILPQAPLLQGLYRLLSNPTPDFMLEAMRRGERATWERMSLIKNHLQIELTIDNSLYDLRLQSIHETRPTRFLKSSQSASNFNADPTIPKLRKRSSSIYSNASVELDPTDIAPLLPRFRNGSRSRQGSPRKERSSIDWSSDWSSNLPPQRISKSTPNSRNPSRPSSRPTSRRQSIDSNTTAPQFNSSGTTTMTDNGATGESGHSGNWFGGLTMHSANTGITGGTNSNRRSRKSTA